MIVRIPDLNTGNYYYNHVSFDGNYKFKKELSKTLSDSIANFIEMSEILPEFISFGSVIIFPKKGMEFLEYNISPFINCKLYSEYENVYENYKSIAKDRVKRTDAISKFHETTTFKLSNELMRKGGGFYYKSIVIISGYENPKYDIIDEKILLQGPCEILGVKPYKDFDEWGKKFSGTEFNLTAMIGIPIYIKITKVIPLSFIWFFSDSNNLISTFNNVESLKENTSILNWLDDLTNLFEIIFNPVRHYILSEYQESFLFSSIKSAIAAIMSRNGSHNIGSHVLSAVSNCYNDLPDDQILFEYIQQRMDFVATISTEFPEWTYPVWFVSDLMRRFYMQRHLLSYIGQSEGLSAFEFRTKSTNFNKLLSNNQTGKIFVKIKRKGFSEFIIPNDNKNVSELQDFQVAIPGGIIGQQAFYTILENIIRNSAKHNWASLNNTEKDERKNLEITIEIDENKKKDYIVFRIWDNASDVFKDFKGMSDAQKKYHASRPLPDQAQLENNKVEEFPLHQQINKKLSESFIERESGKLRKANWGLAEMKISAGFLNMKNVNQIGSDDVDEILFNTEDKEPTGIIRAIAKREKRKGEKDSWHLGYEFSINKPNEFLIIDYEIAENNEEYQKNSIDFYQEKNLKTHDYEFVIIYDKQNDNNEFLKELIKNIDKLNGEIEKYPFRLFLVTNRANVFKKSQFLKKRICFLEPKIFIEEIKEPKQFKIWVYTEWIKHLKSIRGIDNKSINMLINVFGEKGHSQDASLVKLLFENYKERIIEKSLDHEIDNEIKNALKSVIAEDFDEKRKPYKDVETLISELISSAEKYTKKSIDDCTFEKLEKKLKDKAEDYYYFLKSIYKKYEEDIETLPQEYVVKQSENRKNLKWEVNKETRDELKLFLTDTGKDKRIQTEDKENKSIVFSYNRHSKLKPRNDLKYNEALSGAQFYFSLLVNKQRDSYLKEKIILQLIENALLRILIIDERVSKYQEKHVNEKTLEHLGITVPSIKGDQIFYSTDHEVLLSNIANNEYDALIIHQGMLDKIIKNNDKKSIDDFIKDLKKVIPFVLVTSGRGEPDNIPDNAKFLAFSNIESFILKEYSEKFFLTQMLMKVVSREGNNND